MHSSLEVSLGSSKKLLCLRLIFVQDLVFHILVIHFQVNSFFMHGVSFKFHTMDIMDDAIRDCICNGLLYTTILVGLRGIGDDLVTTFL